MGEVERTKIVVPRVDATVAVASNFNNKEFEGLSVAAADQMLEGLLGNVPQRPFIARGGPGEPGILRARRGLSAEDAKKVDSFYAPPPEFTPLGRANLTAQPAFYGSFQFLAACKELDPKEGEVIHVAEFSVDPKVTLYFRDLCAFEHEYVDHPLAESKRRFIKDLVDGNTPYWETDNTVGEISAAMSVISGQFTTDRYNTTALIAVKSIYGSGEHQTGIVYSSKADKPSINVAICPSVAKSSLRPEYVWKLEYLKNAGRVKLLDLGYPNDDGGIDWQGTAGHSGAEAFQQRYGFGGVRMHEKMKTPDGQIMAHIYDEETFKEMAEKGFDMVPQVRE